MRDIVERLLRPGSTIEEREAAAEIERLRAALRKLRDCDWVITLPDRMDAVRDIAKEALVRAGYEAAKKSQRGAEAAYERAEAEIERLTAALREIVEVDSENDVEMDAYFMHRIAKEALND